MNKIDWKTKLTSRKLWAALIAAAVTVIAALCKDEIPEGVADLIGKGVIALCVYIFGEASVDVARTIWNKAVSLGDTISDMEKGEENKKPEQSEDDCGAREMDKQKEQTKDDGRESAVVSE